MQDFPANSQKAKAPRPQPEPKQIQRVTTAEATQRRVPLGRKVKETFVGGSMRGAIEYMAIEVVIPSIQETLIDAFQGGFERLIRGDRAGRRRSVGPSPYADVGRVNYQGMSSNSPTKPSGTQLLSSQSRTRHNFGDILIQSREEARDVLDQMYEVLSRHSVVYVHDLYEMTGIQASHVDYKWGWTRLTGARVVPMRGGRGYLLDLPEPQQMD
jgi:hypothetical protein